MGYLEVAGLTHALPDGRVLFHGVSFRVSAGEVTALIGDNGAGKTTLLQMIAGWSGTAEDGSVTVHGGLAVMPQFVGSVRDDSTVHDLLLAVAPEPVRAAAAELDAAELALMDDDNEPCQLRYAHALSGWADAGGYDMEVAWDVVTTAALGLPYDRARFRAVATLSGGEQKRLVLEALLGGDAEVLLLDEPDNYLDVPGKRWLEEQLDKTSKAVLLISHDRELLATSATRIVTLEARTAWTHASSYRTWHAARESRWERVAELRRRWSEEHARLRQLVQTLRQQAEISSGMASRYRAAQTRLRRFEEVGPPPDPPRPQRLGMALGGGRTGVRVVTCGGLELLGLMRPFDVEVYFGDRLTVLGSNGSGKTHFLRLLAEYGSGTTPTVPHRGSCKLGARVVPGVFTQTHQHPEWFGRTLVELLWHGDGARAGMDRGAATAALSRYGLAAAGDQRFETLSGGQQARFQILMLELSGATLLLLDEPTDNLDLVSAEALQTALKRFEGTIIAVTHDRWFARSFSRHLVFAASGTVVETDEPTWAEGRVDRPR